MPTNRLCTLPNILTLIRIIAIPVVIVLVYVGRLWSDLLAAGLFMLACITDYLDGYFARVWQQMTPLGRFLDPIADKLMVASILLVLVGLHRIDGISLIPSLIILCREILVSGLREFLAELHVSLPVSRLAKWKTTLQMCSLSLLLIGNHTVPYLPVEGFGLLGLWISALLTLWTGYDYLKASLKYMG